MGWLPFIDDENVSDPRYGSTWSHLYEDWQWPEDKIRDFLSGDENPWTGDGSNGANNQYLTWLSMVIPGVDKMIQTVQGYQDLLNYMDTYNLTWKDIIPGHATRAFGLGGSVYGTMNFMSSNIARLYR